MSPELLDPDRFGFKDSRPTKESDCYALGMVIYEVLSGLTPFTSYKNAIVPRKVTEGERPGRPQGEEGAWFTDGLWRTLELCWSHRPETRPTMKAIQEHLEGLLIPPPSRTYYSAGKIYSYYDLRFTTSGSSRFLVSSKIPGSSFM